MCVFVLPESQSIWKRSNISGYDLKYYIAANRSSLKYGEGKKVIYIAYSLAFHIRQYSLQCGVLKILNLLYLNVYSLKSHIMKTKNPLQFRRLNVRWTQHTNRI